jgi:hypothetical protein
LESDLRLPVYVEAENTDCPAAWLERRGRHIPLKRVVDDLEPVVLPGAPTTGAAAAHARAIVERLEDVQVAAAILAGAAEKAEIAITTSPYTAWALSLPSRAWAKPAVAAVPALRIIIEACAEFEGICASAAESQPSDGLPAMDSGGGSHRIAIGHE